jgi:hypothetical protein
VGPVGPVVTGWLSLLVMVQPGIEGSQLKAQRVCK